MNRLRRLKFWMRDGWRFVTCRVFSFGLPTRGDEDWHECTDGPAFLVQRRSFECTNRDGYHYDHDTETLHEIFCSYDFEHDEEYAAKCRVVDEEGDALPEEDKRGPEVGDDQLVSWGDGVWTWTTVAVWFSREEAQDWVDAKSYRGPHRVWSVPTLGDMNTLVRGRTKYDKEHTRSPDVSLEVRV